MLSKAMPAVRYHGYLCIVAVCEPPIFRNMLKKHQYLAYPCALTTMVKHAFITTTLGQCPLFCPL